MLEAELPNVRSQGELGNELTSYGLLSDNFASSTF
jgi:hypothetical protein